MRQQNVTFKMLDSQATQRVERSKRPMEYQKKHNTLQLNVSDSVGVDEHLAQAHDVDLVIDHLRKIYFREKSYMIMIAAYRSSSSREFNDVGDQRDVIEGGDVHVGIHKQRPCAFIQPLVLLELRQGGLRRFSLIRQ